MSGADRKHDAHVKIQLGGLVAKAGLRAADKGALLGALMEFAALDRDSDRYKRLKERGDAELDRAAGK